jgi:hypothetical protein
VTPESLRGLEFAKSQNAIRHQFEVMRTAAHKALMLLKHFYRWCGKVSRVPETEDVPPRPGNFQARPSEIGEIK